MKIMLLADEPSKWLWDFYTKDKFDGIDLIISCGDLPTDYLTFLVSMTNLPLLYVTGNHDRYDIKPPDGCICIDDKLYEFNGYRFLGLGGSMKYKPKAKNQYTEYEMLKRYLNLLLPLSFKGVDVLVTHAPALGVGDLEDMPHRGFKVFLTIMERFKPKYMVHGHVHMNYNANIKREEVYKDTKVVNAFGKYVIEI